jgi:hypothetical protein
MHRFTYFYLSAVLMAAMTLWSSCGIRQDLDDVQQVTLRPEVAVPLLNTVFDVDSLLPRLSEEGVEVITESDGLITLAFEDSLGSYRATNLLNVGTFQVPVNPSSNQIPLPLLNGARLTRAIVKDDAAFVYGFAIGLQGNYQMVINLPDAQLNGQPLTITRTVAGPTTVVGDTLLNGYDFVMPDGNFSFEYSLRNLDNGQFIDPQSFVAGFDSLRFSYAEGRLNPVVLSNEDGEARTDFLSRFEGVSLRLEEPRLYLIADNYIGVPLIMKIDAFEGIGSNGDRVSLQSQLLDDSLVIDHPPLSQAGQSRRSTILFDNNNSNLSDLYSILPERLRFSYYFTVGNPTPGVTNFVDETGAVYFTARTEVPLHFSTPGVTYADTFRLTSDFPAPDLVEWVEFKLITDNGLPLGSSLQIYFFDENRNVIDSLYDSGDRLLEPASVDASGVPTTSSINELLVMLTREEYERFSQATFLGYRISLDTSNQGTVPVKLFSGQQLGIKLGLRALLNASRDIYDSLTDE